MSSCVACPSGDGTEVPGEIGGLEFPALCGACRVAARRADVMGRSYSLPEDESEWLSHRESVLEDDQEASP